MARLQPGAFIRIDGDRIAGNVNGSNVVAIESLTLNWGRDSPLDDPGAATLAFTLYDPAGYFRDRPDLIGLRVVAGYDEPRNGTGEIANFRGRLTSATMEIRNVYDPHTGESSPGWVIDCQASDVRTELSNIYVGDKKWPGELASERLARMLKLVPSDILTGDNRIDTWIDNKGFPTMQEMDVDNRNLAELFDELYLTVGDAWVYWPTTDSIQWRPYQSVSGFALAMWRPNDGARNRDWLITPAENGTDAGYGAVYAAAEVAADAGPTKDLSTAINEVRMSWWNYDYDGGVKDKPRQQTAVRKSTVSDPARVGTRTASFSTRLVYDTYATEVADRYRDYVDYLAGQWQPAPVTIDAARVGGFTDETLQAERIALAAVESATVFYISGSMYAQDSDRPQICQLIGGTVVWDSARQGWRTTMSTSPVPTDPVTAPVTNAEFEAFEAITYDVPDDRLDDRVTWIDFKFLANFDKATD